MPLVKIEDITESTTVGVWEATESDDYFLSRLPKGFLSGYDEERFSEQRRREFLASRFLLSKIICDDSVSLDLNSNGKIKVIRGNYHISLSHSKHMAAAIMSRDFAVGIDIEEIHPRVLKVMRKFLNKTELDELGNQPELWKITLCWAAKESIYKMLDQPGLSFSGAITLNFPSFNTGSFLAKVTTEKSKDVKVYFERTNNYILTYCTGK